MTPVNKRNEAITIARRYARTERCRDYIKQVGYWIQRAMKHAPVSQVQARGFIELMGREEAERALSLGGYKGVL